MSKTCNGQVYNNYFNELIVSAFNYTEIQYITWTQPPLITD